ncbi:TonB-dependent receptor [Larkinella terrae]|uniref:TonB-dependent receptor plug domain-containing protein n=1 Tax=Larkinella terrae TaxID=2025311 RepID=A0A7K0EG34_9BACT|nr:TonB-dependent receptor [Larkinella terrae]MRS60784.1 TonB-dependent receptor plug domain-containing protein [Larkinella terrae]
MKHLLLSIHTFFLFTVVSTLAQTPTNRYTVSGYVREKGSQEALIGVNVYLPGTSTGTVTNTYGFYSLTLPAQDSVILAFSFVGYESVQQTVSFQRKTELNVQLTPGRMLSEVTVTGNRSGEEKVSESPRMSTIDVPINQIKKIPAFLGEKDVLKVLQLMPGVQKGSEGSTGIYVRGGGPDQNLVVMDDAVVYNANHLFGFFSVFNGDALKSVELIKGGFPARYGGRLSSVIEMNMKEGNKEKLHGEGGIGLIASRLTLEGPIQKGKSSFLVSARRTYLDVIARPLIRAESKGEAMAGYYFYDLNAKVNYDFGRKDKVYLSGYFGRDRFFARETPKEEFRTKTNGSLFWGNGTGTLRWNHLFSEKLFSNASLIYSNYIFQIGSEEESTRRNGTELETSTYQLRYNSGIRDLTVKYDLDYYPNPRHSVRFGLQTTNHKFTPSAIVLKNTEAAQFRTEVDAIRVQESGVYAEDTWKPNERWRVNGGFRLSLFQHKAVNYVRPEPRLSAALVLKPDFSIKASYALMNQYVHLLSNTGIGLPTDLWVPTTDRIKPQQSEQLAAGFAKDFTKAGSLFRGMTLTVEGYYKTMKNIINYREGASFLLIGNPESANEVRWEDNVTAGKGWSYGAEFLLQKKVGRFSGWLGYTLSWTQWQFPELNFGKKFFPRYDRRHDISVVGIYELSPRITLSGTWVYGTGNALTVPLAEYSPRPHQPVTNPSNGFYPGGFYPFFQPANDYGAKNSFRAEPYHRMDFGIQFHKKKRHHERTWEFSVYNLYNRRNPFFYALQTKAGETPTAPSTTVLKRYSVFPVVPSFSYNFKF